MEAGIIREEPAKAALRSLAKGTTKGTRGPKQRKNSAVPSLLSQPLLGCSTLQA